MGTGRIHEMKPDRYHYTYGPHEPVLRVLPGDTIVTTTLDAGNIDENGLEAPRSMRVTNPDTVMREVNPLTGPFFVDGAEPGDTLVVKIEKIRLTRDSVRGGASYDGGGLAWGVSSGLSLAPPDYTATRKRYDWRIDTAGNTGTLELPDSGVGEVTIPLNPHFGCIGVAPCWGEVIASVTPGRHGGNMDCVETSAGTTVYLPVSVKGAYLFVGDVHAAQGDGELCGGGLDITAEVTLGIDLVKGLKIGWPRLENREYLMTAASTLPLFDAFRYAQVELIRWLAADYGYDSLDALHLITQIGETRVGNVVDPLFTVVARFPKKYLPR